MSALEEFAQKKKEHIALLGGDLDLRDLSRRWYAQASRNRYSYHFTWLGIPLIQFPQDIVAMQEIIWRVKPDVIIETGVAHGGSLIFHASLLSMIGSNGMVVGIDVDIRSHNRQAIEQHPLAGRITLLEGSSTSPEIVDQVTKIVGDARKSLVILDSNHSREHVLNELSNYEKFVREGSYLIVLDTIIDDMPAEFSANKDWAPERGPKAAVGEFLAMNERFVVDDEYNNKLLISAAPDGYLRCIK